MRLILGDCLEKLKELPDNSVDSVVTDPPYGIGFMNKEWDNPAKHRELIEREKKRSEERFEEGKSPAKGGFSKGVQPGLAIGTAKEGRWFQEWCEEWGKECLRVLKPGGYLLSFSAPRTYHRMTTGFEDAGFEIRDQIMWVFGSGFPKSHNIGKAVDKLLGNEREVVGTKLTGNARTDEGWKGGTIEVEETKGTSKWEGWGTALKPAHEPICVARKPLSEKSNAENVLKWGTGGLNIDNSRIGTEQIKSPQNKDPFKNNIYQHHYIINEGRWPANIILDEEAGEVLDQQSGIKNGNGEVKIQKIKKYGGSSFGLTDGRKTLPQFNEVERPQYNDKGGASRFFYCPKANKKDREDMNNHPTVKPTDLMLYLIKLVTPVGGTVLEPFMGSGSTGKACVRGGFDFIGIEKEEEYYNISKARINNELNG